MRCMLCHAERSRSMCPTDVIAPFDFAQGDTLSDLCERASWPPWLNASKN